MPTRQGLIGYMVFQCATFVVAADRKVARQHQVRDM